MNRTSAVSNPVVLGRQVVDQTHIVTGWCAQVRRVSGTLASSGSRGSKCMWFCQHRSRHEARRVNVIAMVARFILPQVVPTRSRDLISGRLDSRQRALRHDRPHDDRSMLGATRKLTCMCSLITRRVPRPVGQSPGQAVREGNRPTAYSSTRDWALVSPGRPCIFDADPKKPCKPATGQVGQGGQVISKLTYEKHRSIRNESRCVRWEPPSSRSDACDSRVLVHAT